MIITETLRLEVVDGRGLALVDEWAGTELVLTPREAGRLVAAIEWFAEHGRDAIRIPLRAAIEDAVVINNRASS